MQDPGTRYHSIHAPAALLATALALPARRAAHVSRATATGVALGAPRGMHAALVTESGTNNGHVA